jgi:hypothetical protein
MNRIQRIQSNVANTLRDLSGVSVTRKKILRCSRGGRNSLIFDDDTPSIQRPPQQTKMKRTVLTASKGISRQRSAAATQGNTFLPSLQNRQDAVASQQTTVSRLTFSTYQQEQDQLKAEKAAKELEREALLEEAESLAKSLYRICLRSVEVIRPGNEFDEKDFQKRDEEFSNPTAGGVLSMAPPPDRVDELRSRAAYYKSFSREYFMQESDCLDNDPLKARDIKRFLYYLRKGDKDRKWLLGDMLFPDPYKNAMDQERIQQFDKMAQIYLGEEPEPEKQVDPAPVNDGFWDDDESEDPEWFQKNYPHLR